MEVKLSIRQRPPDFSLSLFQAKQKFPFYSLYPKSWENSKGSFPKRFRGIVKKWRLRLQDISMCQCSVNYCLVHVVKEGQTLTSISKQYGVSIYAVAAANKNVVDIDLVYEGQHLNIPLAAKSIQRVERNWSAKFRLPEKILGSFDFSNEVLRSKNFTMLYSHFLPRIYPLENRSRTVGYILVLIPLIAFCIRCVAGAIRARGSREFREQVINESDVKHHRSGGERWKSALGDAWGADLTDANSIPDSTDVKEDYYSEDQAHTSQEEESRAYRKLEHDYQEFLSKCGMSKFGYWRGGSSR